MEKPRSDSEVAFTLARLTEALVKEIVAQTPEWPSCGRFMRVIDGVVSRLRAMRARLADAE